MKTALMIIAMLMWQGWHDGVYRGPTPVQMDVPALLEKRIVHHKGDSWGCTYMMACVATEDEYGDFLTCAEKSRVLLTAEDGTKHCIKF